MTVLALVMAACALGVALATLSFANAATDRLVEFIKSTTRSVHSLGRRVGTLEESAGQAQDDTRRPVTVALTDADLTPSATGAASPRGASRPAPAEPTPEESA